MEERFAELKAQLQVQIGIQDASLSTIVEQPSSGDNLDVALGQESASLTPLAAVGRAAVLEAGSATRDSAVDYANRENFSYILLPAFDTLAVFGAGSATHDTAVPTSLLSVVAAMPIPAFPSKASGMRQRPASASSLRAGGPVACKDSGCVGKKRPAEANASWL